MDSDWQSLTAIALVLLTAAVFALRWLRRKPPGGCGGCGTCGKKPASQ